ncbi:MAG TPA: RagB/SusD family nutrient uptake outer membrane protein [Chitinophagaceae bacterium]|nr:RagB/SusD family nutrient uptake outer membrane protein [Chitinophagaceae bacterium]
MRNIFTTGQKLVIAATATITLLAACKKDKEFFEVEDPQGIDSKIWHDEGAIGLFLNRAYGVIMPQWPAPGTAPGNIHISSDEMNGGNTAFLYGTLAENSVTDIGTANNNVTANRYFDIRRCNLALEGIDTSSVLSEQTKNTLRGQFFFLRGYVYFRMVALYGGVPLVLNVQQLTNDGIPTVPRSKTSECIASIVSDFDSAAALLPANWPTAEKGRVSRGAALAMKGKALMYWASPQFNPTNIASRWEDAYQANLAAYNQCIADGYGLIPSYSNLFITEDHAEALIVRKYNTSRDFGTNIEAITRPVSEAPGASGSFQPTWNLVQAYTMNNGLPITHGSSGYSAIQYWQNRDPRFDATVAYNGVVWPLSGKATRRQWQYNGVIDETSGTIVTGFYCRKFCNNTLTPTQAVYSSNTGGGSGMDWIEMRFAEVIMNLAECANETGRLTEAKDRVRIIRQRAGIVAGSFDYGLAVATDITSMRSLILNERMIEFAMEGKRNMDLRRTRNLHLISARQSYKLAVKLPYVAGALPSGGPVPGRIYIDVPNALGQRPRDTININNLSSYSTVFTVPGAIQTIEGSSVINIPSNYYFYPLPNFFSQQSYVIEQTTGWINGTFDPLQ